MNLRSTIVFLTGLTLSIAAVAGEQHRQRVNIVVDDGSGEPIRFDSVSAGFDPTELQLGESRSIVGEDGSTVFIVRTEDGFELEADGRRIAVPDPFSIAERRREIGQDAQVRVRIQRDQTDHDHVIETIIDDDVEIVHEVEHEVRIVTPEVDDTN